MQGEPRREEPILPDAPSPHHGKPPPEALVARLEQLGVAPGTYRFQPMDLMRRAIARRTSSATREAPHFSLLAKVEADALIAARAELNAGGGKRVSLNDLLIKAAALALKAVPEVNASYTDEGLVFHDHADIAVAVAMPGGLIMPIIRGAETKTVQEISVEMRDLAARGRAKRLAPAEYTGGTFAISNLGMYGITSFGSILSPPHGAVLSVGQAERQFRFRGDEPYAASVMELTLTCDHRVVDGATGAAWLAALRRLVEAPASWLS